MSPGCQTAATAMSDRLAASSTTSVVLLYDYCMTEKRRLSVSVDADLVEAAQATVSAGEAASVSGWVNDALRRQVEHERRLRGIDEFILAFEAEHGEITEAEMDEVARDMRARAIVVRGGSIRRPA